MVQLEMLVECTGPDLASLLSQLESRARRRGAGHDAVLSATSATLARFGDDLGGVPLTGRQQARAEAYHEAVLRRVVHQRASKADRVYRARVRATSAAMDLREAGIEGEALRAELLDTLGFEEAVVDLVVGNVVSVA